MGGDGEYIMESNTIVKLYYQILALAAIKFSKSQKLRLVFSISLFFTPFLFLGKNVHDSEIS